MSRSVNRILIIGLGLIGGSLAKALRERRYCRTVVGYDRNADELEAGLALGVIDEAARDLVAAVGSADIVVLAVPVKATDAVLAEIRPALRPGTLLTDVGSTKNNVVEAARRVFGELPPTFVPGHPIAGSEKSGVAAADAQLFERHKVILTLTETSSAQAALAVARMWQATGAEVLQMELSRHDEVLAATSHLPHLLAFSLVDTLAAEAENTDIFRYAAGGFRDFTRIAASDPTMWHDICLANRDAILGQIDRFTGGVARLRAAVADGDSQTMLGIFTRAKASRDHFTRILSSSAYSQKQHTGPVSFVAQPGGALSGQLRLPGDLSISHRAIMLGSLAEGVTEIEGFLESEDSLATLQAFRDMGVVIEGPHQGAVKIYGVGLRGLQPPPGPLYLGGSGSSMRLLAGLLAAQPFDTELTGNRALAQRGMAAVVEPLRRMGAQIETGPDGLPPLKIRGGQRLRGIEHRLPAASAQVKSALLLAGLYADGETRVREPASTRDHTERMLRGLGWPVAAADGCTALAPGGALAAASIAVPGDISAAALFMVAAAIAPGSEILLEHVGVNPTRRGVVDVLRLMGADIELLNEGLVGAEPVADIRVRYRPLAGVEIPQALVETASDECPLLMVAAACARGETLVPAQSVRGRRAAERLAQMAAALRTLGIEVRENEEGVRVRGGHIGGGQLDSAGEPRVALALAVAALRAEQDIRIGNCGGVAASFPEFVALARRAGIRIRKEDG